MITLTGNSIGAGNAMLAKRFFNVALMIQLTLIISMQIFFMAGRDWFARVFSSDPNVQALISQVLLVQGALAFGHMG